VARLRTVKFKDAVKAFEKIGFSQARQRGSHVSMTKEGCSRPIVIPKHREIAIGTLSGNFRTAGISANEFIEILDSI
jgi:predicted RNA binding protein YcfA (HicA-like mRNA interferase family)